MINSSQSWALKKAFGNSLGLLLPILGILIFSGLVGGKGAIIGSLNSLFFIVFIVYLLFLGILYYVFYKIILKTHKELEEIPLTKKESTSFIGINIHKVPDKLYNNYNDIGIRYSLPTQLIGEFTVNSLYFQTFLKGDENKGYQVVSNKMLLLEYSRKKYEKVEIYYNIYLYKDKRQSGSNALLGYLYGLGCFILIIGFFLYVSIKSDNNTLLQSIFVSLRKYHLSPLLVMSIIAFFFMIISRFIQKRDDNKNTIGLENFEFEKKFDLQSSDPVLARQIFNPSMINNMVEFQKKYGLQGRTELYIDFLNNKLFFKFDYLENDQPFSPQIITHYTQLIYSMIHEIGLFHSFKVLQIV